MRYTNATNFEKFGDNETDLLNRTLLTEERSHKTFNLNKDSK